MWIVTIDSEKCDGAGECVNNCPVEVFKIENGKCVVVQGDLCEGCETCVSVCPTGAITLKEM